MTKFSWVFIFLVAIGLANGIASTALAGSHGNDIYQGKGNNDNQGDDDDQGGDDDDQGDDGNQQ